MTEGTPRLVRDYLAQLDAALSGLPQDIAGDIRRGVDEELTGLDAAEAAARIERLGDPVFIAAEARAEVGETASGGGVGVDIAPSASRRPAPLPPPAPASALAPTSPSGSSTSPLVASRGFAITAALLVAIGGVVVVVLGWIVGIAMVWMSPIWRPAEKWTATLLGPAAVAVFVIATGVIPGIVAGVSNPLAAHNVSWTALLLVVPANVAGGLWLLWRTKGRPISH